MDFLQKLDFMMEKYSLNKRTLSQKSGIPYTTIDGWYKKGYEGMKLSTLRALSDYFNTVLDYWATDDITDPNAWKANGFVVDSEEMGHIQKYRLLDPYGKEAIDSILEIEHRRCTAPAPVEQPQRHRAVVTLHRPFTQVAAAEGAGAFLLDNNYDEVTVELNNFTQKADIILKVVGRSMEPEIHDGDHILVREQPSVEEGEIGVFIIDGNGFLKQAGPDRLISLNPNIEDVIITSQQTAECYGKYICVLNPDWVVEELTAEGAK